MHFWVSIQGKDQSSPMAGGGKKENPITLPISNEIRRENVSASNVRLNQEARMENLQRVQSSPTEEGSITRHIHDVFDHDLGRLPRGVVESPWADLQDSTQQMVNKSSTEKMNASDLRVAAMLKDPRDEEATVCLEGNFGSAKKSVGVTQSRATVWISLV